MKIGLRRRLVGYLITIVALTVVLATSASVLLVNRSLRSRLVAEALNSIEFNLTVLAPATGVSADPGPDEIEDSGLLDRYLTRGTDGVWVEFDDRTRLTAGTAQADASPELEEMVERGEIGYEFSESLRGPVLVTGSRLPPEGPAFFFITSTETISATTRQLMLIVGGVGVGVIALGALAATLVASRMLQPVTAASSAAEAMAAGDLAVRLDEVSSDELGRLSASFNHMAASLSKTIEKLEEAQARERRFVADVSHELRTPLTGLVNEARILAERLERYDQISADDRAVAAMLDDDIARLRRLVEDLLEISRLDTEAAEAHLTPVDLAAFLSALISERHPRAHLNCTIRDPVTTSPRALERIVGNLLDNARTHAPGAEANVTAGLEGGMLVLEVADAGPGVVADELEQIFERFVTADPARRSGSGLGLAIARQHARQLGGDVTGRAQPGGGLIMTLRIPVRNLLHDGDFSATSASDDESDQSQGGRT